MCIIFSFLHFRFVFFFRWHLFTRTIRVPSAFNRTNAFAATLNPPHLLPLSLSLSNWWIDQRAIFSEIFLLFDKFRVRARPLFTTRSWEFHKYKSIFRTKIVSFHAIDIALTALDCSSKWIWKKTKIRIFFHFHAPNTRTKCARTHSIPFVTARDWNSYEWREKCFFFVRQLTVDSAALRAIFWEYPMNLPKIIFFVRFGWDA